MIKKYLGTYLFSEFYRKSGNVTYLGMSYREGRDMKMLFSNL